MFPSVCRILKENTIFGSVESEFLTKRILLKGATGDAESSFENPVANKSINVREKQENFFFIFFGWNCYLGHVDGHFHYPAENLLLTVRSFSYEIRNFIKFFNAQNDPADMWNAVWTTPAQIFFTTLLVCQVCVTFHSQASSRIKLTSSFLTALVQWAVAKEDVWKTMI